MSREKIALFVLMFLVIIFVGVGVSYVAHAGKTWNLAASVVDDTFGSMDGYSVIAYEGTVVPEEELAFPIGEEPEAEETVDGEARLSSEPLNAEEASLAAVDADQASREEIQNSVSNKFLPLMEIEDDEERVYVSQVRALYEEKGASVLSLDTLHPAKYSTPGYFYVGGKLVGVFSTSSPLPATRMAEYSEYFKEKGVEVVLCVTPRRAYLETLDGVDIVLVTGAEERYTTIGVNESDTFVVRAPELGTIGVILITPSNVVSSKGVSSLS